MVLRFIKIHQFLLWDSATQSFNSLASPYFQHFSSYILYYKISLCAEAPLEPSQTSTGLIIWRCSVCAEFPRLFSVTFSEAAFWRCCIKKLAKFCKIHRKTFTGKQENSLFLMQFLRVIEIQKSKSKKNISKRI